MNMMTRKFSNEDAVKVSSLIRRNFLEVNIKDYSEEAMQVLANEFDEDKVNHVAADAHMYVVIDKDEEIIGCGAITSFLGRTDESMLVTLFVMPELQGMGIGRKILEVLEKDEFYTRAIRIEIASSITACNFYLKFGYVYKNGLKELENEDVYRLEKFKEMS
jgi:N-acetylglutamate synthase-like GNAT family acetyltransferase